jgi:DNA-binding LacI/PurR family transcriptional regulator/signal transduction histidine kinase
MSAASRKHKEERKTIGVFVSRVGRSWGLEFMAGISDAAEARDVNLIIFVGGRPTPILTPGHIQASYGLYDLARTEQIAGIILSGDLGYGLSNRDMKNFCEYYARVPLVANALQVDGVPSLLADNLHGMRSLVRHLMDEHNYKRIAFIRGPLHQIEAEQRFLGYRQELTAHKIAFDENLVVNGDFSPESGHAAIETLLDDRKLELDAIVCANDRMAIGALEALQLRSVSVPGKIALTGFEDIREARSASVPLTTVRQSSYELGKQSVELLLRRIAGGENVPESIVTPTQLVVRWSCGCLPDSTSKAVVEKHDVAKTSHLDTKQNAAVASMLAAAELNEDSPYAAEFSTAAAKVWNILLGAMQEDSQRQPFLSSIETLISGLGAQNEDPSTWHNVISALRKHALAGTLQPESTLRAENLFQQVRMLTGEIAQRMQALRRIRFEKQEELLQAFSFSIAPAMSLDEIGVSIKKHLPLLEVERMYIMFYADMVTPESTLVPPSENYRLLMQYDDDGFNMPSNQPKWATGYLIPRGKTPEDRRYTAVVMPLSLAQNRFGFLWTERGPRDWEVYSRLRNLLSSALLRTMLVEQRTMAQKQVERLLEESKHRETELADAKELADKIAHENAILYTSEQQRRQGAEALANAARSISSLNKLDEVPKQILTQLQAVVPYERGSFMMEEHGTVNILGQLGFPDDPRVKELTVPIGRGDVYDQIATSGKPLIIDDVTKATSWTQLEWLPLNHSWAGIPLFSKNRVIGMLSLTRKEPAAFSHDDVLLISTFAMQATIAIENARLYDEVTRFNEMMERMVSQRVEELNNAYITLEKLDKNKTSFIQVAAHELRTPITVIKGNLGILKSIDAIQKDANYVQVAEGALKGTDRLLQIVNSMLDVAKLESQSITPNLEVVMMGLILQLIHKEYKKDLQDRQITLEVEKSVSAIPPFKADPQLLQKALDAIIVNAIKFSPNGSTITIGGGTVHDERMGDCVEIFVRDRGIGIDPANHKVIFDKLHQVGKVELHSSSRTNFKGGGPGLGLALAQGIVRAHQGRLWVESPGNDEATMPGSTFIIRIPLIKP